LQICFQAWRTLPCFPCSGWGGASGRRRFSLMQAFPDQGALFHEQNGAPSGSACAGVNLTTNTNGTRFPAKQARVRASAEPGSRGRFSSSVCPWVPDRLRRPGSALLLQFLEHTAHELPVRWCRRHLLRQLGIGHRIAVHGARGFEQRRIALRELLDQGLRAAADIERLRRRWIRVFAQCIDVSVDLRPRFADALLILRRKSTRANFRQLLRRVVLLRQRLHFVVPLKLRHSRTPYELS